MKDEVRTKEQLIIDELAKTRQRVAELEAADTGGLSADQAGKQSEEALKELLGTIERAKQEWESW